MLPASPPLCPTARPAVLNMYTLTFPTIATIVYLDKVFCFFFAIYMFLELICKAMS